MSVSGPIRNGVCQYQTLYVMVYMSVSGPIRNGVYVSIRPYTYCSFSVLLLLLEKTWKLTMTYKFVSE
jgi:hypothetical protein